MACGTLGPRPKLLRFVLGGSPADPAAANVVALDPSGSRPGRGAYTCDVDCAAQAVRRRAFHRAFRRTVQIPPDLLELMNSG